MRYIFISPHLDDIALSCGGLVNHLANKKHDVLICTIFSGSPQSFELSDFAQSLHKRWNLPLDAPKIRRKEDKLACKVLESKFMHFGIPDCIYRKDSNGDPIVKKEEDLYQQIPASQLFLVNQIFRKFQKIINSDDIVVSPLAIGDHLDHRITKAAIQQFSDHKMLFYEDYPYVMKSNNKHSNLPDFDPIYFHLDDENIRKWHTAISQYRSQISTFWKSENHMKNEIIDFFNKGGGSNLWKLIEN